MRNRLVPLLISGALLAAACRAVTQTAPTVGVEETLAAGRDLCFFAPWSISYGFGVDVRAMFTEEGMSDALEDLGAKLTLRGVRSMQSDSASGAESAEIVGARGLEHSGRWERVGDSIIVSTYDIFTTQRLALHVRRDRVRGTGLGTTDVLHADTSGALVRHSERWRPAIRRADCRRSLLELRRDGPGELAVSATPESLGAMITCPQGPRRYPDASIVLSTGGTIDTLLPGLSVLIIEVRDLTAKPTRPPSIAAINVRPTNVTSKDFWSALVDSTGRGTISLPAGVDLELRVRSLGLEKVTTPLRLRSGGRDTLRVGLTRDEHVDC